MALTTRLVLRQGQTLVMTPQLLQAIKLLQFSHLELSAFVQEELDRNPMLERADDDGVGDPARAEGEFGASSPGADGRDSGIDGGVGEGASIDRFAAAQERASAAAADTGSDWDRNDMAIETATLSADLGSDMTNAFDVEQPTTATTPSPAEEMGLSAAAWTGAPGAGGPAGESPNLEAYVAARRSLPEFLEEQLVVACPDPRDRLIGRAIIAGIDEQGYFREDLEALAVRLGAAPARAAAILAVMQGFEPCGIAARDLAECLALQLKERDRFDPAMAALIAHLPLLARRDYAQLRKICAVDDEDLAQMIAEIRRLDPKPGRAFGGEPIQPVAPDVIVTHASDGGWTVELNSEVLPRVLVNQSYAARVNAGRPDEAGRAFVATCLQNANWLTKSLEQRARTILKVASEIVRQQDAFLAHGVEHLRPLNLRAIAEAIGMHESTVSRVTSNKYMVTPRGLYEMKYFFTAAIPSDRGGEAHSAEAVRHRIRQMIDQERADAVLSDDAIVAKLREANIDIARRTVAKYRESLRIPSSVERRREKTALQFAG